MFVVAGIIYILFGILGKFSAIFITIPYPVLGGAIILMWGTFFGVILSNLQVNIDLVCVKSVLRFVSRYVK